MAPSRPIQSRLARNRTSSPNPTPSAPTERAAEAALSDRVREPPCGGAEANAGRARMVRAQPRNSLKRRYGARAWGTRTPISLEGARTVELAPQAGRLPLCVSPAVMGGSLRDERILSRVVQPEAQLNRTDLKTDAGSLNLIALDHVLVRPLPECDGPRLCVGPEPYLDPANPHGLPAALKTRTRSRDRIAPCPRAEANAGRAEMVRARPRNSLKPVHGAGFDVFATLFRPPARAAKQNRAE